MNEIEGKRYSINHSWIQDSSDREDHGDQDALIIAGIG